MTRLVESEMKTNANGRAKMSSGSLPMSVIKRIGVLDRSFWTKEEAIDARVNMV